MANYFICYTPELQSKLSLGLNIQDLYIFPLVLVCEIEYISRQYYRTFHATGKQCFSHKTNCIRDVTRIT